MRQVVKQDKILEVLKKRYLFDIEILYIFASSPPRVFVTGTLGLLLDRNNLPPSN
jgi:hypothetical protein